MMRYWSDWLVCRVVNRDADNKISALDRLTVVK